jgi:NADPH-dependent 2,4-dienoyl-CoA reductase/sulfur reductase-like enzyme
MVVWFESVLVVKSNSVQLHYQLLLFIVESFPMTLSINTQHLQTDVLIIGGGTAGTMAGIKAKQANPEADVLILALNALQPALDDPDREVSIQVERAIEKVKHFFINNHS